MTPACRDLEKGFKSGQGFLLYSVPSCHLDGDFGNKIFKIIEGVRKGLQTQRGLQAESSHPCMDRVGGEG